MLQVDVVIIGGGFAGLAMSYCLGRRSILHVVLERGQIAERWRTERWDSLRLLAPNWHTRLRGLGGGAIGCCLDAPISHWAVPRDGNRWHI